MDKKKMYIVVIDYSGVSVNHYCVKKSFVVEDGVDESEAVEKWLTENTEHQLSNCSWMSSETEITYNF